VHPTEVKAAVQGRWQVSGSVGCGNSMCWSCGSSKHTSLLAASLGWVVSMHALKPWAGLGRASHTFTMPCSGPELRLTATPAWCMCGCRQPHASLVVAVDDTWLIYPADMLPPLLPHESPSSSQWKLPLNIRMLLP
jgi:hypothetical protein